ncbi:hypothetical protein ACRAWG_07055 [Methylobacterium sp. P31]
MVAMLATIEQLSALADVAEDLSRDRLRSHIAKMLAKIRAGKRARTESSQDRVDADLP